MMFPLHCPCIFVLEHYWWQTLAQPEQHIAHCTTGVSILRGCPNPEIGFPFLFEGLIIGIRCYFSVDSITYKEHSVSQWVMSDFWSWPFSIRDVPCLILFCIFVWAINWRVWKLCCCGCRLFMWWWRIMFTVTLIRVYRQWFCMAAKINNMITMFLLWYLFVGITIWTWSYFCEDSAT